MLGRSLKMSLSNISRSRFFRNYGISAIRHYPEFCDYITKQISEVTDSETVISNLKIESCWRDAGGNKHAAIRADGQRRDDNGKLGAEIVWLIRSKKFRGGFWSHIPKQENSDYYNNARLAFYNRDYAEFSRLALCIDDPYTSSMSFQKMISIANRQSKNKENNTQ